MEQTNDLSVCMISPFTTPHIWDTQRQSYSVRGRVKVEPSKITSTNISVFLQTRLKLRIVSQRRIQHQICRTPKLTANGKHWPLTERWRNCHSLWVDWEKICQGASRGRRATAIHTSRTWLLWRLGGPPWKMALLDLQVSDSLVVWRIYGVSYRFRYGGGEEWFDPAVFALRCSLLGSWQLVHFSLATGCDDGCHACRDCSAPRSMASVHTHYQQCILHKGFEVQVSDGVILWPTVLCT